MLKRQNIKSKVASGGGCLLLLLLAFSVLNPITPAYAEGTTATANVENYELEAFADAPSTVGISFSPTAGSASLTPTTSAGQSAQIKVLATVNVQNSGGYSVYIKSNSQNLIGQKNSSNIIPGLQGSASYDNLPTNTWGYAATEGNAIPDNATYKSISTTGNGDKITENTSSKILTDTKTIALSFTAKIGDDIPADTYQNTITMSVVSSPAQLSLNDVTDMQQMTNVICENTEPLATKQLRDVRDGKYYWVTKLSDDRCWMTQNLALDLDASTTPLTPAASDVSADWMPSDSGKDPAYTETMVTSSTFYNSITGQRSWNLGNYYIKSPNDTVSCGSNKNNLANCTSQFTAFTKSLSSVEVIGDTNAHYLTGNYYQWNTAIAGTSDIIADNQATGSICPKGWKLPTANTGGEFQTLVNTLDATSSIEKLVSSPFYAVRSGYVDANLFAYAGGGGYYWSSTPDSGASDAYTLYFTGTKAPAFGFLTAQAGVLASLSVVSLDSSLVRKSLKRPVGRFRWGANRGGKTRGATMWSLWGK